MFGRDECSARTVREEELKKAVMESINELYSNREDLAPVFRQNLSQMLVDTTDEWITSRTGILERHIAGEGVITSDLSVQAAKRALDMAGITPDQLDLISVATVTPDTTFPSTACVLQRIGILASGKYLWHDEKGRVIGSNSKMSVMYMTGTLKANKSKLKAGDIVMDGDKKDAGAGSHIFILTGKWSGDSPYVWDNHSGQQGKGAYLYTRNRSLIAVVRLK